MKIRTGALIVTIIACLGAATIRTDAAIPPSPGFDFEILRGGTPIGRHTIAFRRDGDNLHVDIEIEIEIELLFITVFRYSHRNREIWRDGRLVSIETETDDNGTPYRVRGHATADGFSVEGSDGRFVAPADIVPTSYWLPATTGQTVLLDSQRGRMVDVSIAQQGVDRLATASGPVEAQRYAVDGDLRLTLWYTPEGEWAKIAFEARGERIEYRQNGETLSDPPAAR
jgi:hypothetical protein